MRTFEKVCMSEPPDACPARPRPWAATRATRWCAGSPERIATGSPRSYPPPVAADPTVVRIAGPGLPRVDRRECRHCGVGGLVPLNPGPGLLLGPLAGMLDRRND
jgi:hypothetical protein